MSRPSTAYASCMIPTVHDPHWRHGVYCAGRTAPAPASVDVVPAHHVGSGRLEVSASPSAILPLTMCDTPSSLGLGGVAPVDVPGVASPAISAVSHQAVDVGAGPLHVASAAAKVAALVVALEEAIATVREVLVEFGADHLMACGCWASEANGRCLAEVTQ